MRLEEHIDEDGAKTIYVYDELEQHIRTTDYSVKGEVTCDIHYDFDKDGQVSGWSVYRPAGVLFLRFEIDYDFDEVEKETRQFNNKGELELRTTTIYDKAKGAYVEMTYDTDGNQIEP